MFAVQTYAKKYVSKNIYDVEMLDYNIIDMSIIYI